MKWRLLRSSKSREQKNEAPRRSSAKIRSAMVWAIVDFPVPASPLSQNTGDKVKSLAHDSMSANTVSRVPLRHPRRFPWRYSAPCARRQPFNTDRSATRHVNQLVGKGGANGGARSDLRPRSMSASVWSLEYHSITHYQHTILVINRLLLYRLSKHLFQQPSCLISFPRLTLTQYSRRISRSSSANPETATASPSASTYPSAAMRSHSPFVLSLIGLRSLWRHQHDRG